MSLQLEDAKRTAVELASNGCTAQAILSQLYSLFDGFRFYEAKGRIWVEGDDYYFPPISLCVLSNFRGNQWDAK